MLARFSALLVLAVLAEVAGFATWQFVALVLSGTALILATAALVVAREAMRRTDAIQDGQAQRLDALEQPGGD